jgi:hypothetical protein
MKTTFAPEKSAELRPLLHDKIDALNDAGLAVMHKVLLQIETEELIEDIRSDFDKQTNVAERVAKALREFRAEHPYK